MGKLKEILAKIKKGWQGLSTKKKVGLGIILSVLLLSLIIYYFAFGRTTYVPVFTNLDMDTSGKIIKKLDEMKVTNYKIDNGGKSILVPKEDVDRLRLELAMDGLVPNNGKGFEIFDNAGFALTDEDRKIMYQRALEGELQRSIGSLKEVEIARVHLVMAEDTIFARETKPASASVILKLKPFEELKPEQIRGIISLVSGAVKNLPEENVRVIDANSNLLSDGIINEDKSFESMENANKRLGVKKEFEKDLEKDLKSILEQTLGVGKVLVKVSAQMDFNSKETTRITYGKDGVIRSQQKRIEKTGENGISAGQSPIDNNTQNFVEEENEVQRDPSVNSYDTTTNYEIDETKTRSIQAPGEIKNLSVSVVYDGRMSGVLKRQIENVVSGSLGMDKKKGDQVIVEGIKFDDNYQQRMQDELEAEKQQQQMKEERRRKLVMYGMIIGIGILLAAIATFVILKIMKRRREEEEMLPMDVTVNEPQFIEEVIKDSIEEIAAAPESQLEMSIKSFAEKNPDKMAELIKAWLLEDER